jgi:hypothetical protein
MVPDEGVGIESYVGNGVEICLTTNLGKLFSGCQVTMGALPFFKGYVYHNGRMT